MSTVYRLLALFAAIAWFVALFQGRFESLVALAATSIACNVRADLDDRVPPNK